MSARVTPSTEERSGLGVADSAPQRQTDLPLIKAVARAHHWRKLLVSGAATSVESLAARAGRERRHVGRTLSLAFLSPEITSLILRGEQGVELRLARLLEMNLPISWRAQAALFGSPPIGPAKAS